MARKAGVRNRTSDRRRFKSPVAFKGEGLPDEIVELLSACLAAAMKAAADYVEIDDAMIDHLAGVLLDGWEAGLYEPDELIARALQGLPITRH